MKEYITLSTIDEIKVYSDPYRIQILNCFIELGKPATVKQIADSMGEVPAKVHYHVKKLEKYGLLNLVDTKVINGIVAKYYELGAKIINIDNEKLESAAEKVFKNEVEKVIHQQFNQAEKTFINRIRTCEDSENKGKERIFKGGILSLNTIYATPEEIMQLKDYIVNFMEQHAEKDDSKIPFEIFNTMVNLGEE